MIPDEPDSDLCERGYDSAWWSAAEPLLRETVWTLRSRLRAIDLWRFVRLEEATEVGALDVRCTDVQELRRHLRTMGFTHPRERGGRWESAERRPIAALHFKHFGGWDADRIEIHVDPVGLHLPWRWWLVPLVPPIQGLRHLADYSGYRDIQRVTRLLKACRMTGEESDSDKA